MLERLWLISFQAADHLIWAVGVSDQLDHLIILDFMRKILRNNIGFHVLHNKRCYASGELEECLVERIKIRKLTKVSLTRKMKT